jgi:tRNA A-37 threonylcarbamoyl transferase component Bud32
MQLPSAAYPNVVKDGPLRLYSPKPVLGLRVWSTRWFVLDDSLGLSYYTNSNGKALGHMMLGHDTVVKYSGLRDHALQVTTPYVTLHMQAKHDEERDHWIAAVQTFIANAQSSKKSEAWKALKKKAEETRGPKPTGTGTAMFIASGQQFEVDARYAYRRTVGQGAYGTVVAVTDSITGGDFAIKKIRNTFENLVDAKRILREIKLLRFLKHKNISHLVDIMRGASQAEDFSDVYIVMPLMDTDLHRVIQSPQKLSDQHIQFLLFQLLSAVHYLESCNVIHRDLKPSNILVNAACELRVCDFGLARGVEDASDDPITVYVVTRWCVRECVRVR